MDKDPVSLLAASLSTASVGRGEPKVKKTTCTLPRETHAWEGQWRQETQEKRDTTRDEPLSDEVEDGRRGTAGVFREREERERREREGESERERRMNVK